MVYRPGRRPWRSSQCRRGHARPALGWPERQSTRRCSMKFGLYSSIANPPRGEHLERAIDEVIAEAQLAEASGFDSCFFGEHHQDRDSFLPSPLIAATAVAAHTRRLNVGTSVILLPLYHPVHVAEDVITLDLVSKGRVILGVGIGYQPADFRAFAVAMEDRVTLFEEGVEILRKCWWGAPRTRPPSVPSGWPWRTGGRSSRRGWRSSGSAGRASRSPSGASTTRW